MHVRLFLIALLLATPAGAETLKGKSYIVELSSSQYTAAMAPIFCRP